MRLEREEQFVARLHAVCYTEWNKSIGKEEECPGDSSWLLAAKRRGTESKHQDPRPLRKSHNRQTDRQTERVNRNGMANF